MKRFLQCICIGFVMTAMIPSTTLAEESFTPELGKPLDEKGVFRQVNNNLWINLRIDNNTLYAYPLDENKNLSESKISSIVFEVDGTAGRNTNFRTLLNPSNLAFTSPRKIYPPYEFFFRLIIRYENGEVDSITRIRYAD